MLYALPDAGLGRRKVTPDAVPREIAQRYACLIGALARLPCERDDAGEIVSGRLAVDVEADRVLTGFRETLEPRLAGDLAHLAGWASKLAGALARIAGICHVADAVDAGRDYRSPLTGDAMARALLLADFLICHASAAHAAMLADNAHGDAAVILRALRRRRVDVVTGRDVLRLCRGIDAGRRDAAVAVLVDHGWLQLVDNKRPERGGPQSPVYAVHPSVAGNDGTDGTSVVPDRLSRLSASAGSVATSDAGSVATSDGEDARPQTPH